MDGRPERERVESDSVSGKMACSGGNGRRHVIGQVLARSSSRAPFWTLPNRSRFWHSFTIIFDHFTTTIAIVLYSLSAGTALQHVHHTQRAVSPGRAAGVSLHFKAKCSDSSGNGSNPKASLVSSTRYSVKYEATISTDAGTKFDDRRDFTTDSRAIH